MKKLLSDDLIPKAPAVGNSSQPFSVGTATAAAHAVRLDQVGRRLGQVVTYQTGAVATGTTTIPIDDTIPQNTEGDQYMSLAITPANASSLLEIDISIALNASTVDWMIAALFRDATASAVAVSAQYLTTGTGGCFLSFKYTVSASSVSATTFKVRAGKATAGTTSFNGNAGARIFGGVSASSITIKEWLP